jgi:hypothetical protein
MWGSAGGKLGGFGRVRWVAVALTVTATGLAACGGDDGDEGGTTAAPGVDATSTQAAEGGKPILIKTRVDIPTGKVLGGSSIGDSPFCPGGTFRDRHGSEDPSVPPFGLVDRTFRCRGGSLRIGFTPGAPHGRTQTGPWKIVSGTGAFEGLRGDGRMKTKYEPGSNTTGRETFTGTVAR